MYKEVSKLLKAHEVDKAIALFKLMEEGGKVPDVYTYNIVIGKLVEMKQMDQATKWMEEMIRNDVKPNVVTFTSIINGLVKMKDIDNWRANRKCVNSK